jgi:hypothetical protein
MRALLLSLVLVAAVGCEKSKPADRTGKLEQVRAAAAKRAADGDRDALANATVIQGVKDLPLSVVGLRVALKGRSNAVLVTFEVEHFDATSVDQLASEAVEDFNRAKNAGTSGG